MACKPGRKSTRVSSFGEGPQSASEKPCSCDGSESCKCSGGEGCGCLDCFFEQVIAAYPEADARRHSVQSGLLPIGAREAPSAGAHAFCTPLVSTGATLALARTHSSGYSGYGPDFEADREAAREDTEQCSYYNSCGRCAEAPSKCEAQCPSVYAACYPPTVDQLTPPFSTGGCPTSGDACDTIAIQERSLENISPSAHVNVVGADSSWENLIKMAWGLLETNSDVLDWASCVIFGTDKMSVISNYVTASWPFRVDVRQVNQNSYSPCGTAGAILVSSFLGDIHMCMNDPLVPEWLRVWEDGSDAERICTLVDLACSMAHELTHISGLGDHDPLGGGHCYTSYMYENTLRWALKQFYPTVTDAACCGGGDWLGDQLYLDDGSVDISIGTCSPASGSGSSWSPGPGPTFGSIPPTHKTPPFDLDPLDPPDVEWLYA